MKQTLFSEDLSNNVGVSRRKPSQQRSVEKVDRILDAVNSMVAADGAEAVSIAALARESGVAAGSIYQYFRNRDDILVAAHDRTLSHLSAELTRSVTDLDLLDGRSVEKVIRQFIVSAKTSPGYLALLKFSYLNKTTQHSEITATDHIGHLISLFVSVWAPSLPVRDAVVTRTVITHILTVLTNFLLVQPDSETQQQYTEELIRHCKFALERASIREAASG